MKTTFRAMILACVAGVVTVTMLPAPAHALRESKPISTDRRLHSIVYSDNEVYKFTGHYDYQSVIEFETGEEIVTVSMGNSVTWQLVPSGNRLFLKPVQEDAMTNMTVITNKRTYNFELHARTAESINDPELVFVMRFVYGRNSGIAVNTFIDAVPDPLLEPEKYNFNYSLTGVEEISPIRIFDDGEFTYFEFRDKNADVPAFFMVHSDGSESLINFRTRGNYIVVERVAAQFTLRNGRDIVCVFNNNQSLRSSGEHPRPIKEKAWYYREDTSSDLQVVPGANRNAAPPAAQNTAPTAQSFQNPTDPDAVSTGRTRVYTPPAESTPSPAQAKR